MKTTLKTLIGAALLLGAAAQVPAAGYIKFDGIEGESTDDGHKDWINILSIDMGTAKPGRTLTGVAKSGKRVRLTRDGRYRLENGDRIIVINGKVNKVEPAGLLLPAVQKQTLEPETKPAASKRINPPGERKGFNPQPEPPARR